MKSSAKNFPTNLSTPINRTARNVVSRGTHHEFKPKKQSEIWDSPPMMRSLIPEHIKPLIKTRKGKLVVVGCVSNKKGIKLVVRCDCGKYETRRPSSWKRPNHSNYCQLCEQMENLRLRHLPMEEVRQIHERQRQTLEVPRKTG